MSRPVADGDDPLSSIPVEVRDLLIRAENLGEEIVVDKHTLIEFDRKRNQNREALQHLRPVKHKDGENDPKREKEKVWLCAGGFFVRMDTVGARDMITNDQTVLNKKIDSLRDDMKVKVSELKKMEGKEDEINPYLHLKPTSPSELFSIAKGSSPARMTTGGHGAL
eukprot:TRINITY_DN5328_c0_g1_i1.p1 TRINITY_DN5328_c0_g1~~TRINITY_DN5328_c0_g1_i1.p1  ORF type:complete len:166 (+),score=31.59 TRINITY_DN5328_c0_g1_i1:148-645(+)